MPNVSVEDEVPQVGAAVPAFRDSAREDLSASGADAGSAAGSEVAPDPKRWLALGVIAIAQLMVVLDASIVTIALPSAAKGLNIDSLSSAQWILTAYTLSFGGLLLLGGRIGDYNGRKKLFIIGLLGFALASGIGGAATSSTMLYAARALQGAFAALLAPAALSLISTTFTESHERAKAFGVYGAISGGGAAIGLIVGGILTEYASWRWCLYVNIPIALLAALGAVRVVRESAVTEAKHYDFPGAVLVGAGLVALVYGTTQAAKPGIGWGSTQVILLLLAAVVLLIGFVIRESRTSHPLLPLHVALDRNRGASYLGMLLVGGGLFAMFLFLTYYFQQNLGYSAVKTGLAFLPFSGGIIIGAGIASQLMPKLGPKPLASIGLGLATIGLFTLTFIGQNTGWATHVLPGEMCISLGMGLVFVSLSSTALIGIEEKDAGVGSALLNAAQQVGGAVGVALLSTVFASSWHSYLGSHHQSPIQTPGGPQPTPLSAIHGYHAAFLIGAALILAAFVIVTVFVRASKDDLPTDAVAAI
jgi:EmrB/QacA subfamily drug resistance transporter